MKRMTYRLEDQYGNPTDSIILESDLIYLNSSEKLKKVLSRLAAIEDILGDEYDLDRLRELAQVDRMIGKEVWAQAKYLYIFQTKPSLIQRRAIQYVSLLKGKDILCHTQTCAFPLNEIGKTVFLTYEEAEAALRREQDG